MAHFRTIGCRLRIPGGVPGKGLPSELDHHIKERLRQKGYVRYMDDTVVFAESKPVLHETLASMRGFLRDRLALDLKESAVRIAPVSQGIGFVGFRIFPHHVRLERRKWVRFQRQVRAREDAYRQGQIGEATLARSVSSLIGHTLHADTLLARQRFFASSLALG